MKEPDKPTGGSTRRALDSGPLGLDDERLAKLRKKMRESGAEVKFSPGKFSPGKKKIVAEVEDVDVRLHRSIENDTSTIALNIDSDLKGEAFVNAIVDKVTKGLQRAAPTDDARRLLWSAIDEKVSAIFGASASPDAESGASDNAVLAEIKGSVTEKWQGRSSKENPAQFIARVYSRWISESGEHPLTRGHLLAFDRKLYDAYASHIRPGRHPEDDLKLPTLPQVRYSGEDPAAELKRRKQQEAERSRRKRAEARGLT